MAVERKSVFVLKAIQPREHPEVYGKYDQNLENGDIEARNVQLGIFDSVEKAEDNIRIALKVQADGLKKHPEWEESKYVFPLSALPFAELTEDMKNKMRDLREKFYKGETL